MKIMFSAGEASGDMHGANLAKAMREIDSEVELIGMGGSQMAAAGVRILYDIKNLGFIGVGEILKKIPFFFRLRDFLFKKCWKKNRIYWCVLIILDLICGL
jgi:lipid-A-disaccharide synthase